MSERKISPELQAKIDAAIEQINSPEGQRLLREAMAEHKRDMDEFRKSIRYDPNAPIIVFTERTRP